MVKAARILSSLHRLPRISSGTNRRSRLPSSGTSGPFGSAVVDGCCLSSPLRNIVIALPLECEIISAVQIFHPLRQAARPTVLATQPVSAEAGKDYRSRPTDRGKQTVAGVV